MKQIEIDDELYHYIASRTQSIGESASDILRRLLRLPESSQTFALVQETMREKKTSKKPTNQIVANKATDLEKAVKKMEQLLRAEHFITQRKNVGRFLMILNALYRANPEGFAKAAESIQGSERIYFARDEAVILATGSGVKAKQIPDSPYWVITNNNTERKGRILIHMMNSMSYPKHLIERIRILFN